MTRRPVEDLTMTIPEVATALRIRRSRVDTLIEQGLPCLRIGNTRLVVRTALDRWLADHADWQFDEGPAR